MGSRRLPITGAIRSFLPVTVVLLILGCIFYPGWESLFTIWKAVPGYSQGLVLGPLSLALIINQYRNVKPFEDPVPTPLLTGLAVFCAVYLFGVLTATQVIKSAAAVILMALVLLGVFGVKRWRNLILPLALMGTTISFWGILNGTLQTAVAQFCSVAYNLIGRAVYLQGDTVFVPAGRFEIEAGCSGLHYLLVAIAFATLYAKANLRSLLAYMLLVIASVVLAILTNWVRVLVIVLAGDLSNMTHYLVTVDHYWFGWGLFALSLIPILMIGSRILVAETRGQSSKLFMRFGLLRAGSSSYSARVPVQLFNPRNITFVCILLYPLLVASAIDLAWKANRTQFPSLKSIASDLIMKKDVQQRDTIALGFNFQNPAHSEQALYTKNDSQIDVSIAYYLQQKQGAELISYDNLWHANDWVVQKTTRPPSNDSSYQIRVLEKGRSRRVVALSYIVGWRTTDVEIEAKIAMALQQFVTPKPVAALAVSANCKRDCAVETGLVVEVFEKLSAHLTNEFYYSQ